jgi:hypothetical protein
MDDASISTIQNRLARVEGQNRVLFALLCATAGLLLIGAAAPGPNVITVDEVRAHQFTLLDPNGHEADTWGARSPRDPEPLGWSYYTP